MVKRLISSTSSELLSLTAKELIEAIAASEGRVMVAETVGAVPSMFYPYSNAEAVAAFGADMIILNVFDVDNPMVYGYDHVERKEVVREVKRLTGRPVGINLEPVDEEEKTLGEITRLSTGRLATASNGKKAAEMGVDFIVLTGNPGTGVSNKAIAASLKSIRREVGDSLILIAGKMHAAGSHKEAAQNIITKKDVKSFVEAGADVILFPAPGTVPGITMEYIRELVDYAHSLGVLTLTAIGTSQEGADEATIREIALMCKMTGTDMHHIGDAGYPGMAVPENITAYSIAIRGKRHTYNRMVASVNR